MPMYRRRRQILQLHPCQPPLNGWRSNPEQRRCPEFGSDMLADAVGIRPQGSLPNTSSRVVAKPLFKVLAEFESRRGKAHAELGLCEKSIQVRLRLATRWVGVPLVPPLALLAAAEENHNRPGFAALPDVPSHALTRFVRLL